MLAKATQLAYDIGQGVVGDTLQLILDTRTDMATAEVGGFDASLDERHGGLLLLCGSLWLLLAGCYWPEASLSRKTSITVKQPFDH